MWLGRRRQRLHHAGQALRYPLITVRLVEGFEPLVGKMFGNRTHVRFERQPKIVQVRDLVPTVPVQTGQGDARGVGDLARPVRDLRAARDNSISYCSFSIMEPPRA